MGHVRAGIVPRPVVGLVVVDVSLLKSGELESTW